MLNTRIALVLSLGVLNLPAAESNSVAPSFNSMTQPAEPEPRTARERFNAGTRRLNEGKLRDSEALLQSALAMQDGSIRAPALYNLGHVRFLNGKAELEKAAAGPALMRGAGAGDRAGEASSRARNALEGSDVEQLLSAYLNGRGARRELRAARSAIRRALEVYGAALRQWQRALGDFKSASELDPADADASQNARIVEREIARVVDSIREMQQMAQALGMSENELRQLMENLRGRIPAPLMPPGDDGDDEEEEGGDREPEGEEPRRLREEGPGREGQEVPLTPEQAQWILEGFQLDGERRLPMGQEQPGDPEARKGRDW